MKQLFVVLMLFIVLGLKAQSAVGLAAYQDPYLAFFKDDHGNSPYTFDMTFKLKMQGYQGAIGYLSINAKYRYSDLRRHDNLIDIESTGYLYRYGAEAQYTFNTIFNSKWEFSPLVGYGLLKRSNTNLFSSWEFGAEVSYHLIKGVKATYEGVWMGRGDLEGQYMYNGSVGLQFDISTDYMGKDERFKQDRESRFR